MTITATAAAKNTATATAKPLYEVITWVYRNNDGEYKVTQYAKTIKAAQVLVAEAITGEGYKLDDYEVANWNGVSVSAISKGLNNMGDYSADVDGKSARVMVSVTKADATAARLADALLTAERVAKGEAVAYRKTRNYPTTIISTTTTSTTEPMNTTTTTTTTTTTAPAITPADLSAISYATLAVHEASPYAKYNGWKLEVKQVLVNGVLALVIPNNGGNTGDFGRTEYTDYTPANAEAVDLAGACGGTKGTAPNAEATAKQSAACGKIGDALKAGLLVVLRAPGEADAVVVKCKIQTQHHGDTLLCLTLADTKAPYAPYSWESIIVQLPTAVAQ